MKKLKNETGRSMVEMLGVLAVVGVLSVAGIAGYTSAMRQYRANEIVNAVAKLYVWGQAQNQGNGDQELPYTTIDTKLPRGVSALKYNADKSISITITDEDDYAMVKNKLGDKASEDTSGSNYSLKVSFEETTTQNIHTFESCIADGSCYNTEEWGYHCTNTDYYNPPFCDISPTGPGNDLESDSYICTMTEDGIKVSGYYYCKCKDSSKTYPAC